MNQNMRLLMLSQARKHRMGSHEEHAPRYIEQRPRRDEHRASMGGEGYFIWDGEQPENRQNVTDMRQYRPRSSMGSTRHATGMEKGTIGFGENEKAAKGLTREKAESWVRRMRSDEHSGGMWTMADAKELAKCYELEDEQDLIDFYAALNMIYSDYSEVAKAFGVDDEAFYAALACAFLYDDDGKAPAEKLAAYYSYVVPHGEA